MEPWPQAKWTALGPGAARVRGVSAGRIKRPSRSRPSTSSPRSHSRMWTTCRMIWASWSSRISGGWLLLPATGCQRRLAPRPSSVIEIAHTSGRMVCADRPPDASSAGYIIAVLPVAVCCVEISASYGAGELAKGDMR